MDMPLTIISIAAVIMFCRQVTVSKPGHIRICSILVQGLSNIANKCTKKTIGVYDNMEQFCLDDVKKEDN